MNNSISFLLIDDDKNVINDLEQLITSAIPKSDVLVAFDGNEGWSLLVDKHPNVVICNISAAGLSGIELVKKIRNRNKFDDLLFIVLTDENDREKRSDALQAGADDFIMKPFGAEEIVPRLMSVVRLIRMQNQLKEENLLLHDLADELEQDIQDVISVCIKFLQSRIPSSSEMLKRIANAAKWIAKNLKLDNDETREVEIASMLSYAGRISLPDELLNMPVLVNGQPSHNLMYQIPGTAREIVSSFSRFKNISDILYHMFENFDGSGFPDNLKKWQIPISSRIIRVCLEYEEARFFTQYTPTKILSELRKEENRFYDPRVITLLEQYLAIAGEAEASVREKAVKFSELKPGMVLSRDVFTNSGLKLIVSGTVLSEKYIQRILSHNTSDPILGNIIIKVG